jgi:hypothetical protein
MDTAMAILNNRFQIMAQYRKLVIGPLVKQELEKVDASVRHLPPRQAPAVARNQPAGRPSPRAHRVMLAHSQALKTIYEKRLALQQIWAHQRQWPRHAGRHQGLGTRGRSQRHSVTARLRRQLKTYSLRPTGA